MSDPTTETVESSAAAAETTDQHEQLVESTLVEEVSIDGMCGVY